MIFLTVGTQFPFDRLIQAVDNMFERGLIDEGVFAQIGESSYKPRNFGSVGSLEKHVFDRRFKEASSVISHAGMGTITMALDHRKPLLVMPRLKRYGEVVNDHQAAIASKLEELGHILVACTEDDLPGKIERLRSFTPKLRKGRPEVVADRIAYFLRALT